METETKKKRSIIAILIAIVGILMNLEIVSQCLIDRVGQYDNYIENLEHNYGEYLIDSRLGLYHLDNASVILGIFCIVVYVLMLALQHIRPLYLLIPTGCLIFGVYSCATMKFIRNDEKHTLLYVTVAFLALVLILTVIAVLKGKVRFAFWSGIASVIAIGVLLYALDSYLIMNCVTANAAGNAAFVFFALNAQRERKAMQVQAPAAPIATEPVAFAATPVQPTYAQPVAAPVAGGSLILGMDTLIIDEEISLGKKSFKILNEQGAIIGFVNENINGGAKASRILLGKKTAIFQNCQYQICELNGSVIFGVVKKGLFGSITDAYGNIICTIKGGKFLDPNGNIIMKWRSTLTAGNQVMTTDGAMIATFKKEFFSAKAMLTTADKYTVSITPGTPADQRILAIGSVLVNEMITGNS